MQVAASVLFYGCRNENEHLYKQDFEALDLDCGKVKIHCAYSRHTTQKKIYVQDMIKLEADSVERQLKAGGVVYVCGDANQMAKDVWLTLVKIRGQEEMEKLKKNGKYLEDVWS